MQQRRVLPALVASRIAFHLRCAFVDTPAFVNTSDTSGSVDTPASVDTPTSSQTVDWLWFEMLIHDLLAVLDALACCGLC